MVRSKQQTQAQEANYENVVRDTLSVSAGKSKEIVSSLAASAGLKEKKASKVAAKVLKKLCAKGVVEKNNNGSFQIVDPSAGKKKKSSKKNNNGSFQIVDPSAGKKKNNNGSFQIVDPSA